MNCITSFLWHFFILFSLKYERKIIPSYNETLRACFTVVKSKFFYFFSYESSCEFFNTTRKKLVTLNFSVKKKSIWNWIHTLYDYWNFISFLIQQTFVYLVLKFIFILVCSHYRNRTLSVLHNLRNSLVCTDKKINWATAVPTRNQPWPYLYHFTLFWNRTTPQQQLKST